MAQASNTAGTVAIRGALLAVLLVGALVSTAEATRNSGLGAVSAAAAPDAVLHPTYFLDCMMECATQFTRCMISCLKKPLLEAPHCAMACSEVSVKCGIECHQQANLGPTPHA
jgi:hypothetical protein